MNINGRSILLVGLAIVLAISLFLAPSLSWGGPDLASASTTDGLTAAQRDKIVEIARDYAEHTWTPTAANIWDVKVRGNFLDTPPLGEGKSWVVGEEVTGVPYKWYGFSSLRPYVISSSQDFDEQLKAGYSAGDAPWSTSDAAHKYAAGVDCSGLVSRAWQLPIHHYSGLLKDLCGAPITFESVLRGDLLYWSGGHVMLVGEDFDPSTVPQSILAYEAVTTDHRLNVHNKVVAQSWTLTELTNLGYTAHRAPAHKLATPTQAKAAAVSGLFAGAANPGVVYMYKKPANWGATSLFSASYTKPGTKNKVEYKETLPLGYAVLCLVDYQGYLYAGTMDAAYWPQGGRVYRLHTDSGANEWLLVGDDLDNQVSSLVVYSGELYAGTSWNDGRLYRCDGTFDWSRVVDHRDPGWWSGFRAAYVWTDGWLYLGDIGWDIIGRYDGTNFQHITHLGGSCIWDFASYGGELYASAYQGRLFKSSDGISWENVIGYGLGTSMWELEVFNDSLYMGLGDGRLERYAGTYDGLPIIQKIWTEPDGNGVISMVVGPQNKLFLGVGGEAGYYSSTIGNGRVYSYDGKKAPQMVCTEELGTGVQVLYNAG